MSICSFEKKCGIGNGTVGRWEDGKINLSLQTLAKIEELAKKSGVTRPYICALENEKRAVVKNTTMKSIVKALNASVAEIFFDK